MRLFALRLIVSVAKIAMAPATCAGSSSGATFASLRAMVSARETSRTSARFGRSDSSFAGTVHPFRCGAGAPYRMKQYRPRRHSHPPAASRDVRSQTKRPGWRPGPSMCCRGGELLCGRDLGEQAFVGLVGLLGEVGVEFTELGRLGDEALIARLDVVALHLDRLLQRLGAEELLQGRAAVFEALLRIVRELGRDRLPALRHAAELLHAGVDIVFAKLLDVLEILEHESPLFGPPHCASGPVRSCGYR